MLLAVNISNTNILIGVFEEDILKKSFSFHTDVRFSADEYAAQITMLLNLHNVKPADISGIILACVVPSIEATIKKALAYIYPKKIFVVGPGLKTGVAIKTEMPSQVGSSIICQCAAILDQFTPPCLLISMGTALSMFALDANKNFVGGAILPGLKLSAKALSQYTAQLPDVDISAPVKTVIGTNSVQNIQAGIILGTACSIDGMIQRFRSQLGDNLTCIATGDLIENVITHCTNDILYYDNLVLQGMRIIYNKNK